MVDVDGLKEQVRKALGELARGQGVQRANLRSALSDDLIQLWHIRPSDSPARVREIVRGQLDRLIEAHLTNPKVETATRYSFNITDDPDVDRLRNLGERQKLPASSKEGMSDSTIQGHMRLDVLPVFAESLVTDPPGPMPEPEQPAGPTTSLELPKPEPAATVQQEPQPAPPADQPETDEKAAKAQKRKKVLVGGGGVVVVLAAVIVLLVSLNSEDNPNPGNNAETGGSQTQTSTTGDTSATTAEGEGVAMVFDDLDGGEPIIQVYPGVSDSKADKLYNATYRDGQTVYALCKTKGRKVHSHPELGERDVPPSDDWIRFHAVAGIGPYATAIYVENPDELLAGLPEC